MLKALQDAVQIAQEQGVTAHSKIIKKVKSLKMLWSKQPLH